MLSWEDLVLMLDVMARHHQAWDSRTIEGFFDFDIDTIFVEDIRYLGVLNKLFPLEITMFILKIFTDDWWF